MLLKVNSRAVYVGKPGTKVHSDAKRVKINRLGIKLWCPERKKWMMGLEFEPAHYRMDKDFGNGEVFACTQVHFLALYEEEKREKV